MYFKIVYIFTYKERSYIILKFVTSLFGLLYSPKVNCENRAGNRNLVRRGATVRLYITNISF
jgi:hypothetical protein